jgi:hypothetical protein
MADLWVGIDLGKLTDYTAAAVIQRSLSITPNGFPERTSLRFPLYRFNVLALRRYALGTPYTGIVSHIVEQVRRPLFSSLTRLVIDGTGVGGAVVEMFRTPLSGLGHVEAHSITITGGRSWSKVARYDWHVAKVETVGAIREALESRRLKVPPSLEYAQVLKRELLDFRVKLTAAANETFNARQGSHDDLVLALALPIWLANHRQTEMGVYDDRRGLTPAEKAAFAAEEWAIDQYGLDEFERERKASLARRLEADRAAQLDPDDERWWKV